MKSVGIIGGTFDPVHHGHLITAQALVELRNLEKIIFIPCHVSPHKTENNNSLPADRLKMVQLAVKDIPYFDISLTEINREGISYTIDTLRELKEMYGSLEVIIGYDNLEKFYTWKEPDEILKLAKLIVMDREVEKKVFARDKYYEMAAFVKTPAIDIKAADIRRRVSHNLPVNFLVPDKVNEYIVKNKLYK